MLQDTSAIAGSEGRYSRPDITLAAIRAWKYDPKRTLEVYSFEVKNRKGSNVPAVYEVNRPGNPGGNLVGVMQR